MHCWFNIVHTAKILLFVTTMFCGFENQVLLLTLPPLKLSKDELSHEHFSPWSCLAMSTTKVEQVIVCILFQYIAIVLTNILYSQGMPQPTQSR